MHFTIATVKALSPLLALAAWGAMSEQQAEAVFEKHRAWFEYVVQRVATSRDIHRIELPGNFFEKRDRPKLNLEDQKIYLDVQTGMKDAMVRSIEVVGPGYDVKKLVSFVMDGRFTAIMAVSPGYRVEDFISPDEKCRPLVDARWYVCTTE